MNKFSSYTGVILIVIGAIILTLSYFLNWMDSNLVQGGAFVLMIIGVVLHRVFVGLNV